MHGDSAHYTISSTGNDPSILTTVVSSGGGFIVGFVLGFIVCECVLLKRRLDLRK